MGEGLVDFVIAYLDTNVVVWLAQGAIMRISQKAQVTLEDVELLISPMVPIELEYLYELKRIKLSARDVSRKLEYEIGVAVCELPLLTVATAVLDEKWTRDPFNRTIVAHAKANGLASLISADEEIAQHYPRTIW